MHPPVEAYGLAVHEALCCGVPVIVSSSAGIAERMPAALAGLLLHDVNSADDLATRFVYWRDHAADLRENTRSAGAVLRQVIPTADRQKATVRVRIGFEELEARILPDMGVKVSFFNERQPVSAADAPVQPRLLVPKGAVRTDGGQAIVFVVHEDRAERRAVTVGATNGDQIEVVSGVNAGERIVVEGVNTLTDGARVKER